VQDLISVTIDDDGTIVETFDVICMMTGFRTRHRVEWLGEGVFRSEEEGPS
jgi:hypothetical protein